MYIQILYYSTGILCQYTNNSSSHLHEHVTMHYCCLHICDVFGRQRTNKSTPPCCAAADVSCTLSGFEVVGLGCWQISPSSICFWMLAVYRIYTLHQRCILYCTEHHTSHYNTMSHIFTTFSGRVHQYPYCEWHVNCDMYTFWDSQDDSTVCVYSRATWTLGCEVGALSSGGRLPNSVPAIPEHKNCSTRTPRLLRYLAVFSWHAAVERRMSTALRRCGGNGSLSVGVMMSFVVKSNFRCMTSLMDHSFDDQIGVPYLFAALMS